MDYFSEIKFKRPTLAKVNLSQLVLISFNCNLIPTAFSLKLFQNRHEETFLLSMKLPSQAL